jgi:hypothetical protein
LNHLFSETIGYALKMMVDYGSPATREAILDAIPYEGIMKFAFNSGGLSAYLMSLTEHRK